jgi:hypothetical protein
MSDLLLGQPAAQPFTEITEAGAVEDRIERPGFFALQRAKKGFQFLTPDEPSQRVRVGEGCSRSLMAIGGLPDLGYVPAEIQAPHRWVQGEADVSPGSGRELGERLRRQGRRMRGVEGLTQPPFKSR